MLPRTFSPQIAHDAFAPSTRAGALAARVPAPAASAVLCGLLGALAFDAGGYFPSAVRAGATGAAACLALLLTLPAARRCVPAGAGPAFLALAALAAWTGVTSYWSPVPEVALLDMLRGVLYAGLFGLGLVAAASPRAALRTVRLLGGAIVVVAGAGVLSRLQPDLLGMTRGASAVFDERLSYPLGYWNALGALAAVGAVLAVGLAADERARTALRAPAAAVAPLLAVAIYLSLSRGAWLALAAGLVALLVLSPRPLPAALSALLATAAGAVAIARLQAHPELLDGTRAAGAGADRLTVEIALLMVAAAGAQALLALLRVPPRVPRRALIAGALASAALLVGAGAVGWAERQYHDFRAPPQFQPERGAARLLTSGGLRGHAYETALGGFAAQPLRGEGAGSFELRWERERPHEPPLRDAHSLVLGTMTELGAVGLLALLAFLGCVARAALRCRRGGGALRRSTAAAVGAAATAWLVHACIDWAWEIPALTGLVLALCATLFARRLDPVQKPHARARGESGS